MSVGKTYYDATLNGVTSFPNVEKSMEVDTCIIGGGFAGLMTQLGLLERGHNNVVLLEQHRVGWGASGRNGGFVFAGYSLSPQAIVQQIGEQAARALYQLTVDAVSLIRQRVADFAIDCDVVDEGVILANWFRQQRQLFDLRDFMRDSLGVDWEYLSPERLHTLIRTARYYGGLFETNAMHLHPLKYAHGIARKIQSLGGVIYERSPVVDILVDSTGVTLEMPHVKIRCRHLVMCAGGYINRLFPPVSRAILPIATYIMVTEKLSAHCRKHLLTNAAIYDTRFAFDYYRPLVDGRLLWGGRISASTRRPKNLEYILRRDLARVFPDLRDVRVDYLWDGWMGYSRHQMPCIGRLANGVWYNLGFGGHGVGPTTVGGELIAAAIAQGDDQYRRFAPWGLPWAGGALGAFAAQSSYWWYQLRDWIADMHVTKS